MNAILVIEDDVQSYQLIESVLRTEGFGLRYARNAEAAYELMKEQAPQLILLDLRLPGLDGWTFAQQLKQHPAYRAIPIVAITVRVHMEDEARALAAGIDQYIAKPFNFRHLRAVVHRYLDD